MNVSKGYFLEKWFKIWDMIKSQMNQIFLNNGVNYLDLGALPKSEYDKWKELLKKSDRVTSNITKIILTARA